MYDSLTELYATGVLPARLMPTCFAVLHHEQRNVKARDQVDMILMDGLV